MKHLKAPGRGRFSRPIPFFLFFILMSSAAAQTGGPFAIEKSVIAGGGGTASGGTFRLDGTVGQWSPVTNTSGGVYDLGGGFWGGGNIPVTSAFTVAGQVLTPDGRGIRNATVSITDPQGIVRKVTTGSLGFFSFDNVKTGETHTIRAVSKRFRFQSVDLTVTSNLSDVNLIGIE